MLNKRFIVPTAALLLTTVFASGSANAVAITPTVSTSAGTTYTTTGLTGFATSGSNMDGMRVTAYFNNGSNQTAVWSDTGASSGAASGTGWSLSMAGDTNTTPWILSNSSTAQLDILRLLIEAAPGNTVFDYLVTPVSTPGSSFGGNIGQFNGTVVPVVDGPAALAVSGAYRDRLMLNNVDYGDLYLTLDLGLSTVAGGGLASGQQLTFASDTDSIARPGDITQVPEPGSLALAGVALAGLVAARRKRSQA